MRLPSFLSFLKPVTPVSWWAPKPSASQTAGEPDLPPQPMFQDDGRGRTKTAGVGLGRDALPSDTIKVLGQKVARIAPPIEDVGRVQDGLASVLHDLFSNRGLLKDRDFNAYRDETAVADAMKMPLVPGHPGGKLTLFRPGLGNTAAGPAQIAYLARHTDRLIIAHANPGQGAMGKLRPATAIDGVPLPPELQGKVFEIGSPEPIMISWEQGSDLLLDQLDRLTRSPLMEGYDPRDVGINLVGHSQGGLDAAKTRERLESVGLDIVKSVGTLGSPFGGSTVSNESMLGLATEVGERALGLQAAGAVNRLDPDVLEKDFTPDKARLVDAAVIGHTEAGKKSERNLRWFFDATDEVLQRVSWMEDAAKLKLHRLFGGAKDRRQNDGMVSVASQSFGQRQIHLDFAVDHGSVAENPLAMKALLEGLA